MRERIADNAIPIKTSLDGVFSAWLDATHLLLHNLTSKERVVMAAYLRKHYELSQKISDEAILERILKDDATKKEIIQECGIKKNNLQVVLTQLKKDGLMIDGKISPKLIPDLNQEVTDRGELRLLIMFNFNDKK